MATALTVAGDKEREPERCQLLTSFGTQVSFFSLSFLVTDKIFLVLSMLFTTRQ